MKTFPALLMITLISWGASSEELGTITGRVKDALTQEPVPNANVVVLGSQRGDMTNFAGEFSIHGIPPGLHIVRTSLIGYVAKELEVETGGGRVTDIEVPLREDDAIRLGEIIVNANRVNAYPQTNLLVSDVERRWPKDVGEFLRSIPGGSSIRKGGTALDPVIRGFRQDQVNVQVDGGMKVWGACPNRMDPPTSHIQSEDLERIEVLTGPFSVRFGPTFGAIINLVMEKPEQVDAAGLMGNVESGYESNGNGKRARATLMGGFPLVDAYVSGGLKTFGSYRAGDGSDVQAGFRMHDYSLKVGLNPGTQERIQFTHRGAFMRDVYYPALMMDGLYDDTHMYALDYARKSFGSFLSSVSAKAYGSYVSHAMGNQWKPTYASTHMLTFAQTRTLGGRLEGLLTPASDALVYVGADVYDLMKSGDRTREFLTGMNKGKTLRDTVWQDSYIRDIGAFLETRLFLTGQLTVIGGIRLDNVNVRADRPNAYYRTNYANWLNVHENNGSGVAALLYTMNPYVDLRLGIGHGVRTADMTERFVYLQSVGVDRYDYIGNPALKPERNTQIELAANARASNITMRASVYYSYLTNFISARLDNTIVKASMDALGVKRFVNVNRAEMAGCEGSLAIPVVPAFKVNLCASYTYGQNNDIAEPLPEMPPLSATATIQFQPLEGPSWAELEWRLAARQTRISTTFQESPTPGFGILSLRTGTSFFQHLNLTAAVMNIFDVAYAEHLNRRMKADGQPLLEPGRSFTVNLQYMY